MTISDLKITSEDYANKDVTGLPDRPSEAGMSAQALKERFDASTKHIVQPKFNSLIEVLVGTEGAANIGIEPVEGVAGYTIQQFLAAIKLLLDDKQSIEQSNIDVDKKFDKAEAQSLVKSVEFTRGTGVFTITHYDGTEETIDTPIEKIPLSVRLEEQEFVLTLDDGTEQRVDISKFLTETEVKNSDTITLSLESGAIVARLVAGSIEKMHLSTALTEYVEGKEGAAADSAAAALVSEQNARNSAVSAEASYQGAKTCQEQACLCATNAQASETNAAKSESNALDSANKALASEKAAEQYMEEAKMAAGGNYLREDIYDPQGKKQDIFQYVDDNKPFDFENWVYRIGYSYETVKNTDGSVTKQILTSDGTLFAESVTQIASDGSIVEHMICESEKVNAVKTTVKNEDGSVTTTITEGVNA